MTAAFRCYEVTMPDWPEYRRDVNAASAGAARTVALRSLRDAGYEVEYRHLRVRSLGVVRGTERLARVAKYRERPDLVIGARVVAAGRPAVILDADDSANFVVGGDDGRTGHVHHADIRLARTA